MIQETYSELKQKADEHWNGLVNGGVPYIRIGSAMCGHASGAFRVEEALRNTLDQKGIKANIGEVGCIGLCFAEPLVDIKKHGRPRIFFKNVAPDDVETIIESYLINDSLPEDLVLGHLGDESSVGNEPSLETLPGIYLQNRIALRNAGHIAPSDILQYIANDGYNGLHKALTEMEPADVIEEVKNSGVFLLGHQDR